MTTKPFGSRSSTLLSLATPNLRRLFEAVNTEWQCTILGSSRTEAQEADYVNGTNLTGINPEKKVLSQTMKSKHVVNSTYPYARAVDVAPDPVDFERKNYILDQVYFAGFVMAKAKELGIKIRYGGSWDRDTLISNESFKDLDHFEEDD